MAYVRPLQNPPFFPISASDSNFNPQNTRCIPVVNPARAGSPSLNLGKNKHFSKVSIFEIIILQSQFFLTPDQ